MLLGRTLISKAGDRYTIANEGWNADLEACKPVVFYLLGTTDILATEITAPSNYAVNGESGGVVDGRPLL